MPRAPWLTGAEPTLERAASDKLATDARRERLQVRGLEGLPVNQERARVELAEGERALRSSRPPNGRRWGQLAKHDDAVDKATQRHAQAQHALQQAEQRLQEAPAEDARTLADWFARGERGKRPASSLYERERERGAARLLVDAAALELDAALARRLQHVEQHREKMTEDARRDVEQAQERLLEQARQLPRLRDELLAARGALEWAATFPELTPVLGTPSMAALGLKAPVEQTLGVTAQLPYTALIDAIEADALALAHAHTPTVANALGAARQATPASEAMWTSDPRAQAWGRQELERARKLAEYQDPTRLAAEAADFRPDPAGV